MLILITYYVSTVEKAGHRRLRRVARACEDYGVRVQKSVFECQVGKTEWVLLRQRLLNEIQADEDSLRFYFLDETAKSKTRSNGSAIRMPRIARSAVRTPKGAAMDGSGTRAFTNVNAPAIP